MIPSHQITYNLHKSVFLLDKLADRILRERLKMTFSQFRVLMAIGRKDVCQKDIADFWDMTEAAVSRQIEILAGKKLITKKENAKNRRARIVSLTSSGEKLLQRAFTLIDGEYEEIYKDINQKERKVLVESLDKLLCSMCKNHQSLV